MNKIINYSNKIFEDIKHIDENGIEYWEAREIQKILEYKEWRNFKKVIDKAMITCKLSNYKVSDHFVELDKTVPMPSGAKPKIIKIINYQDMHVT